MSEVDALAEIAERIGPADVLVLKPKEGHVLFGNIGNLKDMILEACPTLTGRLLILDGLEVSVVRVEPAQ